MSRDEAKPPGTLPEGPEMISAMRQGVVEALREHVRIGNPVVAWDRETNRVVEVQPADIPGDRAGAVEGQAARIATVP